MVFAPHPDDEVLMTCGIIKTALQLEENITVVIVTNGDRHGANYGRIRLNESLAALTFLGLSPKNIIFLGFGDTGMDASCSFLTKLYYAASDDTVLSSNAGSHTYALPGILTDYHQYLYGKPGEYTRKTLCSDIESVITYHKPNHIYVTSLFDAHGDHSALYRFVVEAVIRIKRLVNAYSPILHELLIHNPNQNVQWPSVENDPLPLAEFDMPPRLEELTPYKWSKIESTPVPGTMQVLPRISNIKYQAILRYRSQFGPFLQSFVKRNEFFWRKDFSNFAPLATVTSSSEDNLTAQTAIKAVDGITDGYPRSTENEWVTKGESAGAWIKLSWDKPLVISRIVLYDRPNLTDHILKATVTFSDGSFLIVGPLTNNGSGDTFIFSRRTVTWVKMTVIEAAGINTGLSEFEVYHQ